MGDARRTWACSWGRAGAAWRESRRRTHRLQWSEWSSCTRTCVAWRWGCTRLHLHHETLQASVAGSMKFWYGSGCGSTDPYLWLMDTDADPVIFVSDLQGVYKNLFCSKFFCLLRYMYFLKVHLHRFPKIKSHKEVTKLQESMFFLLFLLDDNDRLIRIHIFANGSGCGSGRPKNICILLLQSFLWPHIILWRIFFQS